jgi:hypothetical protein
MKIQPFKVTTLEEVVISERAANEGGHVSLNYLPGATFLGAIAARLYQDLSEQETYQVFHSGKVRFGNALPLSEDEQQTYPMPLCWYKKKAEDFSGTMELINYQHGEYNKRFQPEQMRDKYVSLGAIESKNRFTQIEPRFRMKTAIDPEVGTARDNQLFGYTSLPNNHEFIASLEADDDIDKNLFKQILDSLQGELKLGRSRSAEYGAVKIEESEHPDERPLPKAASEVTLWLLADTALQDDNGQPLLHPTAKSVGLPEHFKLDMEKTFIRTRRYAPFNAYRRRRELERLVLSMGSVLYFKSKTPDEQDVDAETLEGIQAKGIGLYRQAGLGRVWINPAILAKKSPQFDKLPPQKKDSISVNEPNHPVFRYLTQRKRHDSDTSTVEKQAKTWKTDLKGLYASAKKLSYVPPGVCPGPTGTQWGRVMDKAKNAPSIDKLQEQLFVGEDAVCKENDPQWCKRVYSTSQKEITDFRQWLRNQITQQKERRELLLRIVARFARLARDVADEET